MRLSNKVLLLATAVSRVSANPTDQEFVEGLYKSLLCRKGDASGVSGKVGMLQSRKVTRSELILQVRMSSEYQSSSAYIAGGNPTGNSDDECGSCSACKTDGIYTACCPGKTDVPPGYSESKSPSQQPEFFRAVTDTTCANCVAGLCKAWAPLADGLDGPTSCTGKEEYHCCLPESSWGFFFLLGASVCAMLYIGVGTLYGQSKGDQGLDAVPNIEFWRVLGGLVKDGVNFSVGGFSRADGYKPIDREAVLKQSPQESLAAATRDDELQQARKKWNKVSAPAAAASSRSPLIEAAMIGDLKKLKKALAGLKEADVSIGDKRGFTAFHHAAANGHAPCVKELVKKGADTALTNDTGETGWVMATRGNRTEVTDLLGHYASKKHKKLGVEAKFRRLEKESESAGLDWGGGVAGLPE